MTRHSLACILPPDLLVGSLARPSRTGGSAAILQTPGTGPPLPAGPCRERRPAGPAAGRRPPHPVGGRHPEPADLRPAPRDGRGGKLVRAEGQPPVADDSINQAYDKFGDTYGLYWEILHRNSIDDQGMQIDGLVHFGTNYHNAFWDGAGHMFFGDGDGQTPHRHHQGDRRDRSRADPRGDPVQANSPIGANQAR